MKRWADCVLDVREMLLADLRETARGYRAVGGQGGSARALAGAADVLQAPAVFDILQERQRQIANGRDAAFDDAREAVGFFDCLSLLCIRHLRRDEPGWRDMWVKIGSLAVSAIESFDRKEGT
jgi:hypothetical protein